MPATTPVLWQAVQPTVAVMNNGPTKGCEPLTVATLRETKSLAATYQMHRNLRPGESGNNTADEQIANLEAECPGNFIKLSVEPDGKQYTVSIPDAVTSELSTRSSSLLNEPVGGVSEDAHSQTCPDRERSCIQRPIPARSGKSSIRELPDITSASASAMPICDTRRTSNLAPKLHATRPVRQRCQAGKPVPMAETSRTGSEKIQVLTRRVRYDWHG